MFRTCLVGILVSGVLAGAPALAKSGPNITRPDSALNVPDPETNLGRYAIAHDVLRRAQDTGDIALALAALKLAVASVPRDRLDPFAETASDIADGSTEFETLINSLLETSTRASVVQNPVTLTGVAPPAKTTAFSDHPQLTFEGRKQAEIYLEGDGASDLDLVVRDEFGIEICRSEAPSDQEYCSWTPRWTGAFVVEVVNHGKVENNFDLGTN